MLPRNFFSGWCKENHSNERIETIVIVVDILSRSQLESLKKYFAAEFFTSSPTATPLNYHGSRKTAPLFVDIVDFHVTRLPVSFPAFFFPSAPVASSPTVARHNESGAVAGA